MNKKGHLVKFPLSDVRIEITEEKRDVKSPLYEDGFYSLNQDEFSMNVRSVGWFYASGGNYVALCPHQEASPTELELFLNGSTYGAILHQRKILPFHGSCFVFNNTGVMLCGESGAGKSSLTAAFCLGGAEFLTDDVTPVIFKDNIPNIWPVSDRIKLWEDSLEQLQQNKETLNRIRKDFKKYYYPMQAGSNTVALQQIIIIEIHDKESITVEDLSGIEKFTAIRNEIYRWEYLQGMPESEAYYLKHLLAMSEKVHIQKIKRPPEIPIKRMVQEIKNLI